MQITDNIDYLIKLQPLFKRVLGEWKWWDGGNKMRENENVPIDGNIEKYAVNCCNEDCAWSGYSTDCVCFKHDYV